ncbi:phage tail protein [Paenibacillus sp. SEL3]
MTAAFAKGGKTAQQAFLKTAKAIEAVKDPVLKNAVSVQLFGTQAEDLEARVIKSYGNVKKQFDKTKNTIDEMAKIKYSSMGDAFKGIGRQLLTSIIIPVSNMLLPAFNKFSNWFNQTGPMINKFFSSVGTSLSWVSKIIMKTGQLLQNTWDSTGYYTAAVGISTIGREIGLSEENAYKLSGAITDITDRLSELKPYVDILKGLGDVAYNVTIGTGDISGVQQINKGLQSIGFSPDQAIQISNSAVDIFDNIRGKAEVFVASLKPIMGDIKGYFKEAFTFGADLDFREIVDSVSDLRKSITPVIESIATGIGPALHSVASLLVPLMKVGKQAFNAIIPLVMKLSSSISSKLGPVFTSVFGYLTKTLLPQVSSVLAAWLPKIGALFSKVGGLIMAIYNTGIAPVIDSLVGIFKWAWPVITAAVTGAINILKPVIGGIIDVLGGVIDFLTGVFTGNWDLAWQGIKEVAVGIWDSITGAVKAAFNNVIAIINSAIQKVNSFSFTMPDLLGGETIGSLGIPEIPMLADGDITNRPSIMGEAGWEAAIPINNKPRSMNLLEKTNRLMGYNPGGNGDNLNLNFNIVIQGNADKEVVTQAVKAAEPSFRQQYKQMKRQDARTSL